MKKIGGLLLFLIFVMAAWAPSFFKAAAYSSHVTHPAFSENVAKIYNQNSDRKLSSQEIEWLKKGSIEEDKDYWRCLNHFYNPQTGWGLYLNYSAKNWAQSANPAQLYSWQNAISAYAKGDNKKAFIALGHVLHLLEDMGVPAHTRNDRHLLGDPLESWTRDNIGLNMSFDVRPIYLPSLDTFFDSLAFYSHNNFLSKDTIGKQINSNNKKLIKVITENGDAIYYLRGLDQYNNVYKLLRVDFKIFGRREYYLDNYVHADYFSLLGPKVVAYGAGLIDLFIKKAEAAKQEKKKQKSWWQKLNPFASLSSGQDNLNDDSEKTGPKEGKKNTESDKKIVIVPREERQIPAPKINNQGKKSQESPAKNKKTISNNNKKDDKPKSQENSQPQNQPQKEPENYKKEEKSDLKNADNKNQKQPPEKNVEEEKNQATPFGLGGIEKREDENNNPQTTINSQPANRTRSASATFAFSSDQQNCIFKCSLNGGQEEECSSSKTYQGLSEGNYTFSVYAKNQNGEKDETPATYSWIVDLSGPQATDIQVFDIGVNSASVTFNTSEQSKFRLHWGTSINYGNTTSQSQSFATSHGYKFENLNPDTTYHFQIETEDELGNIVSSGDNNFTTNSASADHLVISEVQVAGQTSDDEWIEIYNPTDQEIDISGYSIQYRGSDSQNYKKKNFTANSSVPARGFYLITKAGGYTGSLTADMSHNSFSLSGTGGNIFLVNNQQELNASSTFDSVIDRLAYGSGNYLYPENSEFATAPQSGQSLERKANQNSTALGLSGGGDEYQGNAFDLNNNSQDFVLQESSNPQNSQSPTEPRDNTNLNFSQKQEIAFSSGSATNSVNYPKILPVSSGRQEIIWQKHTSTTVNLYNKKRESGSLDVNQGLISKDETVDNLLRRDSKLVKKENEIYSFFLAQPTGQQKMLYLAQKGDPGWGEIASVTFMDPSYSSGWDIALDSSSNIHLAWEDRGGGGLKYQKCNLGQTISCNQAQDLNQTGVTGISILLDSAQNPHLIYWRVNERDIREKALVDGSWNDNLVTLTNQSAASYAMQDAFFDNSGNFYLAWTEERGNNLWDYYYMKKTGGNWSEKEKIEEGMGQRDDIDIVASSNNVFVMSINHGDTYRELNIWKKDGANWLAPQKIANDNQSGDYTYADIGIDASDKVYIVWKYDNGVATSRIYYTESQ